MMEVLIHRGKRFQTYLMNNKSVKGCRFRRHYGKAAALHTGFGEASGDVVITMDSDLQDSPDEIPGTLQDDS